MPHRGASRTPPRAPVKAPIYCAPRQPPGVSDPVLCARLACIAPQCQDDHPGATARRGGVDRSDVDLLLCQPGRDPGERARLVPEPQRERRLLAEPILGHAERALGPDRVVDQQPDLPAAGRLGGAECRDVDAGVSERAGQRGKRARSRLEAEREPSWASQSLLVSWSCPVGEPSVHCAGSVLYRVRTPLYPPLEVVPHRT